MDSKKIEEAIREAALRVGCDPEQAEDLLSEFWEIMEEVRRDS